MSSPVTVRTKHVTFANFFYQTLWQNAAGPASADCVALFSRFAVMEAQNIWIAFAAIHAKMRFEIFLHVLFGLEASS